MEVDEATIALVLGRQQLQILALQSEVNSLRAEVASWESAMDTAKKEAGQGWPPLRETPNHHPTPMPE